MKYRDSRSSVLRTALLVAIVTCCLSPAPSPATDCSTRNPYPPSEGNGIAINSQSSEIPPSQVSEAIGPDYWSGCPGMNTMMPGLCTNCSAGIMVTVVFNPGQSTNSRGSCGRFTPTFTVDAQTNQQRVSGGVIEIWEMERGTGVNCGPDYSDKVAHEIGHVLGLDDATSSDCNGRIMGSSVGGQDRSVQDDDCQEARDFWTTDIEKADIGDTGNDDTGECGV